MVVMPPPPPLPIQHHHHYRHHQQQHHPSQSISTLHPTPWAKGEIPEIGKYKEGAYLHDAWFIDPGTDWEHEAVGIRFTAPALFWALSQPVANASLVKMLFDASKNCTQLSFRPNLNLWCGWYDFREPNPKAHAKPHRIIWSFSNPPNQSQRE